MTDTSSFDLLGGFSVRPWSPDSEGCTHSFPGLPYRSRNYFRQGQAFLEALRAKRFERQETPQLEILVAQPHLHDLHVGLAPRALTRSNSSFHEPYWSSKSGEFATNRLIAVPVLQHDRS